MRKRQLSVPRIAEADDPTVLRNVLSEFVDSDGADAGADNDGVIVPVSLRRVSGDDEPVG